MAIIFLVLFMILAALNWFAAWRGRQDIEYIVKPAATAALVLFSAAGGHPSFLLIAALTLCLLGDVFLMLPGNYFLAGLSAFLLGHLAYIGLFPSAVAARLPWFLVMSAATLPVTIPVLRSIKETGLKVGVVVYMGVICFMAGSAIASGSLLAVSGALLFVVSDALIAWDMFVRKLPRAHFWVMVTYHIALLGLVLALRGF